MIAFPIHPPRARWCELVELALVEDVGSGDITSSLLISPDTTGTGRIEAREPLVACGLAVAEEVFRQVDPSVHFQAGCRDGDPVSTDGTLAVVTGPLRGILCAERTALNFLSRLSGVAGLTRRFVEAVAGTGARIVDTRKTLPGWRVLDKYAAAMGGALNHRFGLYDGILLKDNHIAASGGVAAAVKSALALAPAGLRVQVEVQSADEAEAACGAGADFLLIDNCSPDEVEAIARSCGDRALIEASGGVGLENVRAYAEAGAKRISVGVLTHSAPAADIALEIVLGGVAV